MKNNEKKDASGFGMDNPHKLTPREQEITTEYAGRIKEASRQVVRGWVETGRLVKGFLDELRSIGSERANYHQILADNPQCPWSHSQLRNYEAAFELWEHLGGEKSGIDLPITHWIQLLPKTINSGDKKELLAKAQAKTMTVRELQDEIRLIRTDKAPSMQQHNSTTADAWVKATTRLQDLLDAEAHVRLLEVKKERRGRAIPRELSESLLGFVRLAIECGFLSVVEITGATDGTDSPVVVHINEGSAAQTEMLMKAA